MKKLVSVVLLILCTAAHAAPVDSRIRSIIRESGLKNADIGLYAVSLPKGKVLADLNKDLPMNPASCMKLITSAVALKTLGPDYQFPTRFYLTTNYDPQVGGHDLWIKGYGDPALVIERLDEMVTHLIRSGLPVAINDIYIDDTFFDSNNFPGRQKGSSRSYNALTGAVALNHGAVTVEVFPGDKQGARAQVVVDAPGINIDNRAQTAPKRSKTSVNISRTYTKKGDTVVVTGRIPLGSGGKKRFFSVANPAEHFGESLMAMLQDRGISIAGDIRYGMVPRSAKLLLEERSPPLSQILKNMNKNSNNFMAEQITKTIGAKVYGEPGNTEKGIRAFNAYLASLGNKDFLIENGSGLSYKNEISPYLLFTVMNDVYSDPKLRNVYLDSLSIAGEDGTLKRSHSMLLSGRMKAKTGSLNGVSSLAGFVPDGRDMIVFVIFINGHVDFWKGRSVSQRIVEELMGGK